MPTEGAVQSLAFSVLAVTPDPPLQSERSAGLANEMMAVDSTTLERPMTALEKLHIIVGYAIVRRDLR